jgi:hypothetical protein
MLSEPFRRPENPQSRAFQVIQKFSDSLKNPIQRVPPIFLLAHGEYTESQSVEKGNGVYDYMATD